LSPVLQDYKPLFRRFIHPFCATNRVTACQYLCPEQHLNIRFVYKVPQLALSNQRRRFKSVISSLSVRGYDVLIFLGEERRRLAQACLSFSCPDDHESKGNIILGGKEVPAIGITPTFSMQLSGCLLNLPYSHSVLH